MKNLEYSLKFLLNSSAIFLIVFGIVKHSERLIVSGSYTFLASLFITMLSVIRLSIKYKKTAATNTEDDEGGINKLLDGAIILYGMVALFFIPEPSYFRYSGQIIWFGTILFYVLNGILASSITNIPLKMTHGGWKAGYRKRYKRK